MANSFRQTHQMLADVKAGIVLEAEQEAALLSELAIQSAKNNSKYSPRDKEHLVISYLIPDKLIDEISRLAEVTSDLGPRGRCCKIGLSGVGLDLVSGNASKAVEVFYIDHALGFSVDGTPTSQVVSGKLKGLQESYALASEVIAELDQLAFNFAGQ